MDESDTIRFDPLMTELACEDVIQKTMSPFRSIFDEQSVMVEFNSFAESFDPGILISDDSFNNELLNVDRLMTDSPEEVFIDFNINVNDKECLENDVSDIIEQGMSHMNAVAITFDDQILTVETDTSGVIIARGEVNSKDLENEGSVITKEVESNSSIITHKTDDTGDESSEVKIKKKPNRKKHTTCDVCDRVFSSRSNMRMHKLNKHGVSIPFPCKICNESFPSCRDLITHRNDTHRRASDGMFECSECGKAILEYHNFTLHLKMHAKHQANPNWVECELCGKVLSSVSILRKHWLYVHSSESSPQPPKVEETFTCSFCGNSFTNKKKLSGHLKEHKNIKLYQCTLCDKVFPDTSHLKVHIRLHGGSRDYQCPKCDKAYYLLEDLKKHRRNKHPRKQTFTCEECGLKFTKSREFRTHRRTHTGVKLYDCDICGRDFVRSSDVIRHKRIHTGEEPYECKLCDKRFKQSGLLNTHIKKFHPESEYIDFNDFLKYEI